MKTDPERPVSIARCDNVSEADMLKLALETEGIEASVDGATLNTTFGVMSGPMISSVKLIVRQRDADNALKVVEATRASWCSPDRAPWFCGVCREEIEGGFEICWCCGGIRADVETEFPPLADSIEIENFETLETSDLGRDTDNPYESPRAMGAAELANPEREFGAEAARAESRMLLGLLFSLGSMLLPVIPALVAGAIFRDALKRKLPFSVRAKLLLCVAVAISIATHVFWFWFLMPHM